MKWTVAGAGALLCISGIYALMTGDSIIQVERGWATFIAGAVLFSAGVVVLGMAALIGRVDQLIAATGTSGLRRREPPAAAADAAAMNRLQHALHDVPPPPREVSVEALPTLERMPPESAMPEPMSVRQPPPMREGNSGSRPASLRDFEFEFPPAEASGKDTVTDGRVEPLRPLTTGKSAKGFGLGLGLGSGLGAGLGWLRSGKADESANLDLAGPLENRRALETSMEDVALVRRGAQEQARTALHEPEKPSGPHQADVNEAVWSAGEADSLVGATVPDQPSAAADPFTNNWLERALADHDTPRETGRFTPPSVRRAAAQEQQLKEEAKDTLDDALPGDPDLAPREASAVEERPRPHDSTAGQAAPVEIGRYRANDVAYVMFSDGSITAETPAGGAYRFTSLVELRVFIERGGT